CAIYEPVEVGRPPAHLRRMLRGGERMRRSRSRSWERSPWRDVSRSSRNAVSSGTIMPPGCSLVSSAPHAWLRSHLVTANPECDDDTPNFPVPAATPTVREPSDSGTPHRHHALAIGGLRGLDV